MYIYLQSNFYSLKLSLSRVFSHDVTADIHVLVSQNNAKVAMMVSQTNLAGVELFSYVSKKCDGHIGENTL